MGDPCRRRKTRLKDLNWSAIISCIYGSEEPCKSQSQQLITLQPLYPHDRIRKPANNGASDSSRTPAEAEARAVI